MKYVGNFVKTMKNDVILAAEAVAEGDGSEVANLTNGVNEVQISEDASAQSTTTEQTSKKKKNKKKGGGRFQSIVVL